MSSANIVYKLFPLASLELAYAYAAGFVHAQQGFGFTEQRPSEYGVSQVNMYQLGWIDAHDHMKQPAHPYQPKHALPEPEKCNVCGGDEPCSHDFDKIGWPSPRQHNR